MEELARASHGGRGRVFPFALAIFLPMALLQLWWITIDTRPQSVDAATHLRRALGFADAIRTCSPRQFWMLWRAEWGMYTYPPLFQILTGGFIAAGARPALAGVLCNLLFLWIAVYSLIQIGRRAFSPPVGISAAAIFTAYMFTSHLVQNALLDLALTAMVSWSLWRLLLTDGLTSYRQSIIFGLALGLAMMIKQMALPMIAIPALFVLARRWRQFGKRMVMGLVLAAGAAGAVVLPWYAFHIRILRQISHFNQSIAPVNEGDPMPWTLDGATYYLQVMAEDQVGIGLLAIALAAGMTWFVTWIRRRPDNPATPQSREARGLILFWLIGDLAGVTFLLFNKDYRYNAPMLPALALLTGTLFAFARRRNARIAVAALVAIAAAPYLVLANFGVSNPRLISWLGTQTNEPPRRQDWRVDAILDDAVKNAPQATIERPARMGIVFFDDRYGFPSFALESARRKLPLHFAQFTQASAQAAQVFDFVLIKSGNQGLEALTTEAETVNRFVASHPKLFQRLMDYDLPDKSRATLFRVALE